MTGNKAAARLAVVGAGPIGKRHLQAMDNVSTCQAVAVVDPSPAAKQVADRWHLPWLENIEMLWAEVKPDGVIIATPNSLHLSLSLACINRGIPVLVEKPITDTLQSAHELTEASEAAGVPVLVGHHRRHNPVVRKAREIVQADLLGRLTAISATFLVRKPDDYFETAWRTEPGGGPVLINLIHDVDSLRFIAGDIIGVQSMTSNAMRGYDVEDTAAILLRFKSGALGTVMLSDAVASPWSWELTSGERTSYTYPQSGQDCYLLAGTEASLAVPSLQMWRHDGPQSWQSPLPKVTRTVDEVDPIQAQLAHFANVIQGIAEPLITARDASKTLEVSLAVSKAAATSGEVTISS